MSDFSSLGLSPKVLQAVRNLGYETPTPVQSETIPLVLAGKDVIAGAQTGTGKTAAFCLPCMDKLGHAGKHCGPLMLVVTPTRELADQIGAVCAEVAKLTKHKVTTVVGGVSYNPQREALRRGTDVLIATPGRLEDLMGQESVGLDQVGVVVLDEADRMVDMGFLPAVKRIVAACTAPHQTLLFSATIDDAVQKFADGALHHPVSVAIARKGETAQTVDQYLVRISHAAKPSALKALLQSRGAKRVIVFARTRHRADSCARRISKMGFKAEALHSDKSQNQRRRALDAFAKGKVNVLVATDVLARGIDVDQVDYVVNYDIPTQPEDYIHRIGRTGRAGATGCAISLVCPENAKELRDIEALIKRSIPEMTIPGFDVEAAESDAADRSAQLAARRSKDPEVEAAVKDLSAQKRKQRKKKAQAEARSKAGAPAAKNPSAKKKRAKQASAAQAPAQTAKPAKKKDKRSGVPKPAGGKAPAVTKDMRPGRAHRAAVERQRRRG
ncbi:MAG: DEAD/DEAH box helicase [Coriobacteriia bacterium]|nr:DEAD/DEAH box helicase [Coriobacteriia bacterium]